MKDDLQEYEDLIHQLQRMPKADPQDDFTSKVMGRLKARPSTLWSRMIVTIGQLSVGEDKRIIVIRGEASKTECSFYFFLTGFFYLVMGFVLMNRLHSIDSVANEWDWFSMQPHLVLGTAIWLLFLGSILQIGKKTGVKAARYGSLLYILAVVVNGVLMRPSIIFPYADFFIAFLIGGGLCMGGLLFYAVHKYEMRLKCLIEMHI